ncbi:MAG: hypothetical protein FWC12_11805 [Treponema sp.]|nr:hypothetical protein [Treponema sp.]
MTDNEKTIEEARAGILPYESWEHLKGESAAAFSAFCTFRDLKTDRSIIKAIESVEKNEVVRAKRYHVWRNWACEYRWSERATDYDRYIEQLKQTEHRKTIEAQGEKHRMVTGKMLDVVLKKLETMSPADLGNGTVAEWVQTAIKAEQIAAGLIQTSGLSPNGKTDPKQGELNFVSDFQGL